MFLIDRSAFDAAFKVEGVDAQYLWDATDQGSEDNRSTLIVLCTLAVLSQASLSEKAAFLFDVFDFSQDNALTADDLGVMVVCLTRSLSLMSFDGVYGKLKTSTIRKGAAEWLGEARASIQQSGFVDRVRVSGPSFIPNLSNDAPGEPHDGAADGDATGGKAKSKYAVGAKVLTRVGSGVSWYPATITAVHDNRTYDLLHAGGETTSKVPEAGLRLQRRAVRRHSDASLASAALLSPRDSPEPRVSGASSEAAAEATRASTEAGSGGDATAEAAAGAASASSSDAARAATAAGPGEEAKREEEAYAVGDRVLALFGGRKWYAATIAVVHPNGTYDVEYADGDEDEGLSTSSLKRRDPKRR